MTNQTRVTRTGQEGTRPDRDALTGAVGGYRLETGDGGPARDRRHHGGKHRDRQHRGGQFDSYYGRPVIKEPTWQARDIAGYLFLGGLAGASSVTGAAAQLTGRPVLARTAKVGAAAAIGLSLAALVHDLGRPARFLNMLRVVKPTSPMSVGSWLLAAYAPAAAVAAGSALTGVLPVAGAGGTALSALLGPAVSAYTAVLVSDTAVPAWHEGRRQMPLVFVSSAASSAAGLGLLGSPLSEALPLRTLAVVGGLTEIVATNVMERRVGPAADAYSKGPAAACLRGATGATAAGVVGAAVFGGRSRLGSAGAGLALLVGAALTRLGIFRAGVASARDPAHTIAPQRRRLGRRADHGESSDDRQ